MNVAPKVLLTGTYCSDNRGDATMQEVFGAEVRRLLPGAAVSIGSPFPERDRSYYNSTAVIKSCRRNLPLALLHLVALLIVRAVRFPLRRYPFDAELDAMLSADVVVDLSGDMLTEDYGVLVGLSHFMPLLQSIVLRRSLAVCAQSIGPFRMLSRLAGLTFSRAALLTVRERLSLNHLRAEAIDQRKVHLTADLAFLLPSAGKRRGRQILEAEGIPTELPLLGFSVSALLATRQRHSGKSGNEIIAAVVVSLDEIAEAHGYRVLLVSHVFGPREKADDRIVAEDVRSRMKAPASVLRGKYRADELKAVISLCHVFSGCRMHANIAALDSGVPTAAIGYSHKTMGIMAELGLDEWCLPISSVTDGQLKRVLHSLVVRREQYARQLEDRLGEIRARAASNAPLVLQASGMVP